MAEFHYIVGGQSEILAVDDSITLRKLPFEVEHMLLAALKEKHLEIESQEMRYLQSRIAVAIGKHGLAAGPIDLGEIKTVSESMRREQESEGEYSLINIKDGRILRRDYRPTQSIGAIVADLRGAYDLGMNDNIIIAQVVNGARQELAPEVRVSQLASKRLHWEVRKYDE